MNAKHSRAIPQNKDGFDHIIPPFAYISMKKRDELIIHLYSTCNCYSNDSPTIIQETTKLSMGTQEYVEVFPTTKKLNIFVSVL